MSKFGQEMRSPLMVHPFLSICMAHGSYGIPSLNDLSTLSAVAGLPVNMMSFHYEEYMLVR